MPKLKDILYSITKEDVWVVVYDIDGNFLFEGYSYDIIDQYAIDGYIVYGIYPRLANGDPEQILQVGWSMDHD